MDTRGSWKGGGSKGGGKMRFPTFFEEEFSAGHKKGRATKREKLRRRVAEENGKKKDI